MCEMKQQNLYTNGLHENRELSDKYIKQEKKFRIISAFNKFKDNFEQTKTPRK